MALRSALSTVVLFVGCAQTLEWEDGLGDGSSSNDMGGSGGTHAGSGGANSGGTQEGGDSGGSEGGPGGASGELGGAPTAEGGGPIASGGSTVASGGSSASLGGGPSLGGSVSMGGSVSTGGSVAGATSSGGAAVELPSCSVNEPSACDVIADSWCDQQTGKCTCATDMLICDARCTYKWDSDNCGDCGVTCTGGAWCNREAGGCITSN